MTKKKKNIIGLTFKCENEDCGQVFRIGKNGVEAALGRVMKHMQNKGHMNIAPVNPPKGLTYKSEVGDVKVVFDGKDKDAFIQKVKDLCLEHKTHMIPQLKLA